MRVPMRHHVKVLLAVVVLLLSAGTVLADEFSDAVAGLDAASFNDKKAALVVLQELRDERSLPILKAMLDGRLHAVKDSKQLLIESTGSEPVYHDAFTDEIVVIENSRAISKVRTNNSLRRELGTVIASIELSAESTRVRLDAATNLIKNSSTEIVDLIRDAYQTEKNAKVKNQLAIALAIIDINAADKNTQLESIETLSEALDPEALAALRPLLATNEAGDTINADEEVAAAAFKAIDKIERKKSLFSTFENVFFGLSLGSVLLLAAVGLAITFGVMGVINMAHGEMIMLGAYTTFAVQALFPNLIGASLFIAIPAAFIVSGSVGILIERLVIRHLYGRPLETLLATFGVSLILQQAVRTFRSNNVPVITPDWMSGSFELNAALSITYNRFYIFWFCLLVVGALMLIMRRSYFGLQMRAVTQNRPMANAMGIRSSWVDAATFGLGSGVAGIAGVALSQLTNVGPNMGQAYIIDSFMVVVFGGVGNLFGTVFAALSLGIANKFLEPYAGAVLGKIMVLVFIILFIQWRPRGLFALKGRFVED